MGRQDLATSFIRPIGPGWPSAPGRRRLTSAQGSVSADRPGHGRLPMGVGNLVRRDAVQKRQEWPGCPERQRRYGGQAHPCATSFAPTGRPLDRADSRSISHDDRADGPSTPEAFQSPATASKPQRFRMFPFALSLTAISPTLRSGHILPANSRSTITAQPRLRAASIHRRAAPGLRKYCVFW